MKRRPQYSPGVGNLQFSNKLEVRPRCFTVGKLPQVPSPRKEKLVLDSDLGGGRIPPRVGKKPFRSRSREAGQAERKVVEELYINASSTSTDQKTRSQNRSSEAPLLGSRDPHPHPFRHPSRSGDLGPNFFAHSPLPRGVGCVFVAGTRGADVFLPASDRTAEGLSLPSRSEGAAHRRFPAPLTEGGRSN